MSYPSAMPASRLPRPDGRAGAAVGSARYRLDRGEVHRFPAPQHPSGGGRGGVAVGGVGEGGFRRAGRDRAGPRLVRRSRRRPRGRCRLHRRPHNFHHRHALLALDAGKHVLVGRPARAERGGGGAGRGTGGAAGGVLRRGAVDVLPAALRRGSANFSTTASSATCTDGAGRPRRVVPRHAPHPASPAGRRARCWTSARTRSRWASWVLGKPEGRSWRIGQDVPGGEGARPGLRRCCGSGAGRRSAVNTTVHGGTRQPRGASPAPARRSSWRRRSSRRATWC